MGNSQRKYYIDWLRVVGVLLLIPYHSLLIFSTNSNLIMYVKSGINVKSFNILASIISSFHMPVLFFIAGMAVYYSLQKRDIHIFIYERVHKLIIPLLFGCVILNPIMTYLTCISQNKRESFLTHFITFFTKNPGNLSGMDGGFTPAHLWFLLSLFIFTIVGLPIYHMFIKDRDNKIVTLCNEFFQKRLMLLTLTIPLTIMSLTNILGNKNPFVYFIIYISGFIIASDKNYENTISRDMWVYLLLSIVLICTKVVIQNAFPEYAVQSIGYRFVDKSSQIISIFAIIGLANKFIDKNSKVLKYLSKSEFTVYIIHMIINTFVAFLIIKMDISPVIEYILIITITFILSFIMYEIIRRTKYLKKVFAIK